MAAGDMTPKLVSVFRDERYGGERLRRDAVAGLTVAVVALPLSMAIAIASGLTPQQGLVTAIVGGFLISALGGSRVQIGGPAGAFIVLVYGIVERQGVDGLVLATAMAGVLMITIGLARLGSLIAYVPYPVTVGFTAGIGVIIAASQLKDLFGLSIAKEPAALIAKLQALWSGLPTVTPAAVALAAATIGMIVGLRRTRPKWPVLLIAVVTATVAAWAFGLDMVTIERRFGALPAGLPMPGLPDVSMARLVELLPDALAIALLGSIESLLSAVVADGMTGRRHRPNIELVAQGAANVAAAVFGGMPVTGTIARTATNVRSGGSSPVAGMLHALFLLVFVLVAAPLAGPVPLAALAAVLIMVAIGMIERHDIGRILAQPGADRVVLIATFTLTVLVDLVVAIGIGVAVMYAVSIRRGWRRCTIEFDPVGHLRLAGQVTFIDGPKLLDMSSGIPARTHHVTIDVTDLTAIDTAGLQALERLTASVRKQGASVTWKGAQGEVAQRLAHFGLTVAEPGHGKAG